MGGGIPWRSSNESSTNNLARALLWCFRGKEAPTPAQICSNFERLGSFVKLYSSSSIYYAWLMLLKQFFQTNNGAGERVYLDGHERGCERTHVVGVKSKSTNRVLRKTLEYHVLRFVRCSGTHNLLLVLEEC